MKKSILIVDDSAPLRMLLEAMLQKKYKVYTANDGLSALMWLTNGNIPDLIITDMQMPNINGTEFINILNSNILYSDIPVLILTGNKIQDEILVGQNVVSVLNKPFDPKVLTSIIDSQIEQDLLQVDRAVV